MPRIFGRSLSVIRRQLAALVLCCYCLSGCATVNFSANYYNLPDHFPTELNGLWVKIAAQYHLAESYKLNVISNEEDKRAKGIPFISNTTIFLPLSFLKYIYQNYYNDRFKILTSIITHELCHALYHLPSKPPQEHVKTDLMAIKLLGDNKESIEIFCQSLLVVKSYCFARKGMGGHALNLGFNALSVASMVYGGPGFFMDLYATDITVRLKLLKREYHIKSLKELPRSYAPH